MKQTVTESALALATKAVPQCSAQENAAGVLKRIKDSIAEYESVDYVYVLQDKKLVGVFSLHELLQAKDAMFVSEFMIQDVAYVHAKTDTDHVAELALAQSIKAVPVVDEDDNFVGVILGDVVLRILNDEHRNYLYKLTGITLKKTVIHTELGIAAQIKSRIPWLILGLFGGVAGAGIVSYFEEGMADQLFVAAFIPAIVYIADAVGNQSEMLVVRALSKRTPFSLFRYLTREISVGLFVSMILAGLMFVVSALWLQSISLSTVLALAIMATVLFSVSFTVTLPWLLKKVGFDPAVASGPVATVVCDISSVTIYLLIASTLL